MGTLESLLVTPTAAATVQLGSAVFDLVYMPLRTAVFLGFMVLVRRGRARCVRDRSPRSCCPARLHPVRLGDRHRLRGGHPDLQARGRRDEPRRAPARASPRARSSPHSAARLGRRRSPNTTRSPIAIEGAARRAARWNRLGGRERRRPRSWCRCPFSRSWSARCSSGSQCGANGAAERWGSIEHGARQDPIFERVDDARGALTVPRRTCATTASSCSRPDAGASSAARSLPTLAAPSERPPPPRWRAPACARADPSGERGTAAAGQGARGGASVPDPALRCFRDRRHPRPGRARDSAPAARRRLLRRRATRGCTSESTICVRCSGRGCRSWSRSTARRSGSTRSTRRRWPS